MFNKELLGGKKHYLLNNTVSKYIKCVMAEIVGTVHGGLVE